MILSLFCCWPAGLALLWTSPRMAKSTKIALTAVFGALFAIAGLTAALAPPRPPGERAAQGAPGARQERLTQATPPPAAKQEEPVLTVSAKEIWSDYHANEVRADQSYKGRRLLVKGTVSSISKDFMDDIVVHLASPNQFMDVLANMKDSQRATASGLSKGDSVTVLCVGGGMIVSSPVLSECEFR